MGTNNSIVQVAAPMTQHSLTQNTHPGSYVESILEHQDEVYSPPPPPKTLSPNPLSIKLGRNYICKSFFLYHMSCEKENCPFSHDPKVFGTPGTEANLLLEVVRELRKLDSRPSLPRDRLRGLLNRKIKAPQKLSPETLAGILLRLDPQAITFSPMGPTLCKKFVLGPQGCNDKSCTYLHDFTHLNLAVRSREDIFDIFDSVKQYSCKGKGKNKGQIGVKIFNSEFQPMGNNQQWDFQGLNGAQVLKLLASTAQPQQFRPVYSTIPQKPQGYKNIQGTANGVNKPNPMLQTQQAAAAKTLAAKLTSTNKIDPHILDMAKGLARLMGVQSFITGEKIIELIMNELVTNAEAKEELPKKKTRRTDKATGMWINLGDLSYFVKASEDTYLEEDELNPKKIEEIDELNESQKANQPNDTNNSNSKAETEPNNTNPKKVAPKGSYLNGEIVAASAPEIGPDNIGRVILEKLGWSVGEALGVGGNRGRTLVPVLQRVKLDKLGIQ